VERRIADPRVLRLIRMWLEAGVMEDGKYIDTNGMGTPQGGGSAGRWRKVETFGQEETSARGMTFRTEQKGKCGTVKGVPEVPMQRKQS
ncbi:MAG: hypothetical protein SV487_06010, partial [Thermodesulfobacteriota bacterium]|nr:hypothetical protein [Thermodesulfobacteriota bacterium]